MTITRPPVDFTALRRLLAIAGLVLLAGVATGCDVIDAFSGDDEGPVVEEVVPEQPCIETFGPEVRSAAISRDGTRTAYISGDRPTNLPENMSWRRDDRALYVRERQPGSETAQTRYVSLGWDAIDQLSVYTVADQDEPDVDPVELPEQMEELRLADNGERFVVAVTQESGPKRYAKLYYGNLPEGRSQLEPDDGLTRIPINHYRAREGIQRFAISPDGSRVAAVVGNMAELRTYDIEAQQVNIYEYDQEGELTVLHELPQPMVNIDVSRQPAIAAQGSMRPVWSPDGMRLALARHDDVGDASVWILNVDAGELQRVRTFTNSTIPQIVWASDGASLFVMNTRLIQGTIFGDTELRRIEATADGAEIGEGGRLTRPRGYRTEPANLVGFGDDERFVFTWEGQLWRIDAPGGDMNQASFLGLVQDTDEMTVQYDPPTVSSDEDLVQFVVTLETTGQRRAAVRTDASADACPSSVAPEDGAATEGEGNADGEGDAGSEGDGADGEGNAGGEGDAGGEDGGEGE